MQRVQAHCLASSFAFCAGIGRFALSIFCLARLASHLRLHIHFCAWRVAARRHEMRTCSLPFELCKFHSFASDFPLRNFSLLFQIEVRSRRIPILPLTKFPNFGVCFRSVMYIKGALQVLMCCERTFVLQEDRSSLRLCKTAQQASQILSTAKLPPRQSEIGSCKSESHAKRAKSSARECSISRAQNLALTYLPPLNRERRNTYLEAHSKAPIDECAARLAMEPAMVGSLRLCSTLCKHALISGWHVSFSPKEKNLQNCQSRHHVRIKRSQINFADLSRCVCGFHGGWTSGHLSAMKVP